MTQFKSFDYRLADRNIENWIIIPIHWTQCIENYHKSEGCTVFSSALSVPGTISLYKTSYLLHYDVRTLPGNRFMISISYYNVLWVWVQPRRQILLSFIPGLLYCTQTVCAIHYQLSDTLTLAVDNGCFILAE